MYDGNRSEGETLRVAGLASVVGWERTQVLGRRLVVLVQRAAEVIGVGTVVGQRAGPWGKEGQKVLNSTGGFGFLSRILEAIR